MHYYILVHPKHQTYKDPLAPKFNQESFKSKISFIAQTFPSLHINWIFENEAGQKLIGIWPRHPSIRSQRPQIE
jgi:hypothetical protein